jgi:hypothetical protein
MKSGTKWTTYDAVGDCVLDNNAVPGIRYDATDCKFKSDELDIKAIMDFLSKPKLSNKQYISSSGAVPTGQIQGLSKLWDSY